MIGYEKERERKQGRRERHGGMEGGKKKMNCTSEMIEFDIDHC